MDRPTYWATRWAERLRCNWRCRSPSGSISWWSQMLLPVAYEGNHDVIIAALEAVAARGCVSRAEAEAILNDAIADRGVVGYLLMGLARAGERQDWRFHLAGLRDGYGRQKRRPPARCYVGSALFLRGAHSGAIQPQRPRLPSDSPTAH